MDGGQYLGVGLDELAISTLLGSLLGEESIIERVVDGDTAEIDGGRCGDDVGLVDAAQGHSVQVVWA